MRKNLKIKNIFLIVFLIFFIFLKTVDNENICGEIGGEETHCFFSLSNNESERHICVQCPCNSMVLASIPVKIQVNYELLYIDSLKIIEFKALPGRFILSFFRPPKIS